MHTGTIVHSVVLPTKKTTLFSHRENQLTHTTQFTNISIPNISVCTNKSTFSYIKLKQSQP
jgi:hypothetical protein